MQKDVMQKLKVFVSPKYQNVLSKRVRNMGSIHLSIPFLVPFLSYLILIYPMVSISFKAIDTFYQFSSGKFP